MMSGCVCVHTIDCRFVYIYIYIYITPPWWGLLFLLRTIGNLETVMSAVVPAPVGQFALYAVLVGG